MQPLRALPISRRTLLAGAGLTTLAPAIAACSGSSEDFRVSWWGAEDRHNKTLQMIGLFEERNPDVRIEPGYGGLEGYQDKMATEMSGGNGPDVMQVNNRLPFLESGALLELDSYLNAGIDVANVDSTLLETGKYEGKTFYLPWGLAAGVYFYDMELLDELGIDHPTNEWTWDSYAETARAITEETPDGVYGSADIWAPAGTGSFAPFEMYLRQREKAPYTEDGQLAFERDDLAEWFTFWDELRRDGGVPTGQITALETGFETSPIIAGRAAMYPINSSIASSLQALSDHELGMLVLPNGQGSDALAGSVFGQYINASIIIAANARTANPDLAVRLIDFFLNDPDANSIHLMARGVPPSSEMVALVQPSVSDIEQKMIDVIQYIQDNTVTTVAPPPAKSSPIGDLMNRSHQDIAFERASVEQTVEKFFTEAERALA